MFLENLLFPKFCVSCGFLGSYLCPKCEKKLSYIERDVCLYCGFPSFLGLTHPKCQKKFGLDGVMSIFHYNNVLKKVIKCVKYRLSTQVWQELKTVIKPEAAEKILRLKRLKQKFVMQPLPLHERRQRLRGFNQSSLIADFFNLVLDLPIVDCLKRQRSTLPQAQITESRKRYENIRGAFRVGSNATVSKNNFILVDDVITSGLTLKEAAKELKKAGAGYIYALTLAKG